LTIRVSLAVMAHPSRARFVDDLLSRLDRPAIVVWDERQDRWDTGRRAQLAFEPNATHHLTIQDDAVPCRDLVAGVEKALAALPDSDRSPLCLYVGRVRPYRDAINQLVAATRDDTAWLTMSQLHWGPGIVMPVKLIPDMVAWCDKRGRIPNYDRRISRWCQHQRLTVYYPWPSLVDHRGVAENPSLVPGRSGDRRAHRFLGVDASALDRDWTGGVVSIPALSRNGSSGGSPVKFVSEKYPNLDLSNKTGLHGVRFRDGVCDVDRPNAVSILQSPYWRRRGIRLATDDDLPAATKVDAAEPVQPSAAPPTAQAVQGGETPPDGTASNVLDWVGDNPARARQALEAEQRREKPRTTLVAALTRIVEA
jgi:hypothetical protein